MKITPLDLKNILSVSFEGKHDEGQPGYVNEDEDIYLKELEKRFLTFLHDNYWYKAQMLGFDILRSEIRGPGSSGYPNSLNVTVGFYAFTTDVHVSWFKDVLSTFKENEE